MLTCLDIDGYTTYIYAKARGERRIVVAEEYWKVPGMFEKYVRLSPDNWTLTYAKVVQSNTDRVRMNVVDIASGNRRVLVDLPWEMWVAEPVWSPDSRQVAYVRSTSPGRKPGLELWVVNADGSGNRKLLTHPSFNADVFYGADRHPLQWTPYGDLQYKDYKGGRVYTVDGRTGKLSYESADLQPPKEAIPVIQTKGEMPVQSQNDPRWRYDRMAPARNTLGSFGCALTSVSMSFNALGVPTVPKQLNKDMGDHSALFYWAYASENFSNRKLELWGVWAFDWNMLDLSLAKGRPAMVWLSDARTTQSASLTHWVLVVGGEGQEPGKYRIYDPWDGSTWKTLEYYTSKGYGLTKVYAYGPRMPKKPKSPAAGRRKGGR